MTEIDALLNNFTSPDTPQHNINSNSNIPTTICTSIAITNTSNVDVITPLPTPTETTHETSFIEISPLQEEEPILSEFEMVSENISKLNEYSTKRIYNQQTLNSQEYIEISRDMCNLKENTISHIILARWYLNDYLSSKGALDDGKLKKLQQFVKNIDSFVKILLLLEKDETKNETDDTVKSKFSSTIIRNTSTEDTSQDGDIDTTQLEVDNNNIDLQIANPSVHDLDDIALLCSIRDEIKSFTTTWSSNISEVSPERRLHLIEVPNDNFKQYNPKTVKFKQISNKRNITFIALGILSALFGLILLLIIVLMIGFLTT